MLTLAVYFVMEGLYMHKVNYRIQDRRGRSGTRKDFRIWLANKWLMLSSRQRMEVGMYRYFNT